MSTISDVLNRNKRNLVIIVTIAAAVSVIFLVLVWYAPKWDNPSKRMRGTTREIKYLGIPGELEVACDCPDYVITGTKRSLTFTIRVKVSGRPDTPAPKEELWLWPQGEGIDPPTVYVGPAEKLVKEGGLNQTAVFSIQPRETTLSEITFQLSTAPVGGGTTTGTIDSIQFPLSSRASLYASLRPFSYAGLVFAVAVLVF